ncbi:YphA family membrane protein [Ornithinibacillus contaminans]|uniref:YphA family membrane protein n=1 Tax=Ornithinibacillus contaminans TaxID=694055 RepID=UPI0012EE451B|nr:hypothetical protein [Ornithinibacillus contaminans]
MMDGIYFYWFSWVFWVIVTFLMPKGKRRTILALWLLVAIIFSNLYVTIGSLAFSVTYLIIFTGAFISLARHNRVGLHIFSGFTIMIGYTSILIWETHAPVWLFMPRLLLIPMICVALVSIISSTMISRLIISTLGLCGGELLYSVLLANFSIQQTIGEFVFLDTLLVMLFLLVLMELLRKGRGKMVSTLQAYKQQLRWQNE